MRALTRGLSSSISGRAQLVSLLSCSRRLSVRAEKVDSCESTQSTQSTQSAQSLRPSLQGYSLDFRHNYEEMRKQDSLQNWLQICSYDEIRRLKEEYGEQTMFPFETGVYRNHVRSCVTISSCYRRKFHTQMKEFEVSGTLLKDGKHILSCLHGNGIGIDSSKHETKGYWIDPRDEENLAGAKARRTLWKPTRAPVAKVYPRPQRDCLDLKLKVVASDHEQDLALFEIVGNRHNVAWEGWKSFEENEDIQTSYLFSSKNGMNVQVIDKEEMQNMLKNIESIHMVGNVRNEDDLFDRHGNRITDSLNKLVYGDVKLHPMQFFGYSYAGAKMMYDELPSEESKEKSLYNLIVQRNGALADLTTGNSCGNDGVFLDTFLSSTMSTSGAGASIEPNKIFGVFSTWFCSGKISLIGESTPIVEALAERNLLD